MVTAQVRFHGNALETAFTVVGFPYMLFDFVTVLQNIKFSLKCVNIASNLYIVGNHIVFWSGYSTVGGDQRYGHFRAFRDPYRYFQ